MEGDKERKAEKNEAQEEKNTATKKEKKKIDKEEDSTNDEDSSEEKPRKIYPKFPRMSISIPLANEASQQELNLPVLAIKQFFDPTTSKKYLITGGRDSVIRKWCLTEEHSITRYEAHTNWVNDICILKDDKMASCSSDTSVKLWNINSTSPLHTFSHHRDYVKALWTPSESKTNLLYSAGLDCQIFGFDLEKLKPTFEASLKRDNKLPPSIYSLTGDNTGRFILTGSSDGIARAFDTRIGLSPIFKLKAHSGENIKAIFLNWTDKECFTGTGDANVRLWDLRFIENVDQTQGKTAFMRRHWNLNPNLTAIWGFAPISVENSKEFLVFGKGKSVTWFSPSQSEDMYSLSVGNLTDDSTHAVCLTENASEIWISSGVSKVGRYAIENNLSKVDTESDSSEFSVTLKKELPSAQDAIVKNQILPNKLHILTENMKGDRNRWDVLKCSVFDSVSSEKTFDEISKTFHSPSSTLSWFSTDSSCGFLVLNFQYPNCFAAEIYCDQIFPKDQVKEDTRVHLITFMLKSIFGNWKKAQPEKPKPKKEKNEDKEEKKEEKPDTPIIPEIDVNPNISVWFSNPETGDTSARFRPSELSGTETLPKWIEDYLLENTTPDNKDTNIAFALDPFDKLPSLNLSGKLNSSRMLKIKRVIAWTKSRLEEKKKSYADIDLELVCNNQILDPEWTLAHVKLFVHKSSEEMVFKYRRVQKEKDKKL